MKLIQLVQLNAQQIVTLQNRVKGAFALRDNGKEWREIWEEACVEFHSRYDKLAFPGGIEGARERLRAGEEEAIEYALAFLEVRPYFFRSGYMYKDFMRVLKNCPLTDSQAKTYRKIRSRYMDYKAARNRRRAQ